MYKKKFWKQAGLVWGYAWLYPEQLCMPMR